VIDVEVKSHTIPFNGIDAVMTIAIDVSKRKQAERALIESERRYQSVINSPRAFVCRFTPDSRLITANDAFCKAFNIPANEVTAYRFDEIIQWCPNDQNSAINHPERFESLGEISWECCESLPDGTTRWWQWNEFALCDDDGKEIERQAIGLDITKKKQAFSDLEQTTLELNFILNSVPDLLFWIKKDGTYSKVYTGDENALLVPKEVLIGKNICDILPHEIATEAMAAMDEAFTTGQVVTWKYSLELEGETNFFDCRINAVNNDEAIAVIRNVTENKTAEMAIKESQERLTEAQLMAKMGRWDYDHAKDELTWTDSIYPIFGITPDGEHITYQKFLKFIHPEDREALNQSWQASLENREPYRIEHRIIDSLGNIKWMHEFCHTVFDESGKPLHSVGIVQDITKRKTLEEALRESEAKLKFAVGGAGDGIWELNIQTGEMITSPEWKSMLGYSADNYNDSPEAWVGLIHPEYLEKTMQMTTELFSKYYYRIQE
jgi:PAS domain S-box-containing protein